MVREETNTMEHDRTASRGVLGFRLDPVKLKEQFILFSQGVFGGVPELNNISWNSVVAVLTYEPAVKATKTRAGKNSEWVWNLVNSEGVGQRELYGVIECNLWADTQLSYQIVSRDLLLKELLTGETVDMTEWVRNHNDRLENNLSIWVSGGRRAMEQLEQGNSPWYGLPLYVTHNLTRVNA